MSALRLLPQAGRDACRALGAATPWPAEEWAIAVLSMSRAGLFPAIGLEQLVRLCSITGNPPSVMAEELRSEAVRLSETP